MYLVSTNTHFRVGVKCTVSCMYTSCVHVYVVCVCVCERVYCLRACVYRVFAVGIPVTLGKPGSLCVSIPWDQ